MITEEIFIGRQPILDRSHRLVAYELLFRSCGLKNEAHIQDPLGATANVIIHAFAELGVEQVLGPYKGFLNCDATLLFSGIIDILPPDKIVLEVLETVELTPEIVERCTTLKERGFTLALDDFVHYEDKWRALLDQIDIVKVDVLSMSEAQLTEVTRALQRWPATLLAEKVDNREQADYCHKLGYGLFQGYYFARPVILAGSRLSHTQMSLLRLLGLVLEDAETQAIEGALKREPGLAMNLLRLTNSVATGLRIRITSLRHAITVLGRKQLQRWLQLLLYTNPSGGDHLAGPLLQLAATRGRFLELLAGKLNLAAQDFADHAFMTGILSLMPALMNLPLAEVLKSIKIVGDVQQALEHRAGTLGIMLQLAEALEAADGPSCHTLTGQLAGADHLMVNACLAEALNWASNIGKENL